MCVLLDHTKYHYLPCTHRLSNFTYFYFIFFSLTDQIMLHEIDFVSGIRGGGDPAHARQWGCGW